MKVTSIKASLASIIFVGAFTSCAANAYTITNNGRAVFQYAIKGEPNIVKSIPIAGVVEIPDSDEVFLAKGDGHEYIDITNANIKIFRSHSEKANAISGFTDNELESFMDFQSADYKEARHILYPTYIQSAFYLHDYVNVIIGGIKYAIPGTLPNSKKQQKP